MSTEIYLLLIAVAVIIFIAVRRLKSAQSDERDNAAGSQNTKSTSQTEQASEPTKQQAKPAPAAEPKTATQQTHGASTGVPEALASEAAGLQSESDPVARHRLLQQMTEHTYRERKDPAMREACRTFSEQHIEEFSEISAPLKKSNGGKLPHVSTFQNYANLLVEDGNFGKAIEVCEKADKFGLDDKTKSGFKGRIARIKKQQEKAAG